ncbi:hypothetical protein SUGI_0392250 [Cryptomeria japonica]|nr:hypothetical protein SUGI_0392250 [Cryptomeria japonica]
MVKVPFTSSISAIALDCEMVVGGDEDDSLDLCAGVCLVDEEEKVVFQCYVKPPLPIADYRLQNVSNLLFLL